MPRDYTPYAMIETTFILSDPRYKKLPASSKVAYIALWARAFQERRELLPDWYDTRALQEDSALDARTVQRALAGLLQSGLVERTPAGRIKVCGVKSKGRIQWKDGGVTKDPTLGQRVSLERREENRREEQEQEQVLGDGGQEDFSGPPVNQTTSEKVSWLARYWTMTKGAHVNRRWREEVAAAVHGEVDLATARDVIDAVRVDIAPWDLKTKLLDAAQVLKPPDPDNYYAKRAREGKA